MRYRNKDYHCYVATDDEGYTHLIYDTKMLEAIKGDMDTEISLAEMDMNTLERYMEKHKNDANPDIETMKAKWTKALQSLHIAGAMVRDISEPYDEVPYIIKELDAWQDQKDSYYDMLEDYEQVIKRLEND